MLSQPLFVVFSLLKWHLRSVFVCFTDIIHEVIILSTIYKDKLNSKLAIFFFYNKMLFELLGIWIQILIKSSGFLWIYGNNNNVSLFSISVNVKLSLAILYIYVDNVLCKYLKKNIHSVMFILLWGSGINTLVQLARDSKDLFSP